MNWYLRRLLATGAVFAILYGLSYWLYRALPYVGEGARIIYEKKLEFLEEETVFPTDARRRIAVFGNSKVLSGFLPDLFDSLGDGSIYSYNLGLPDASRFVPAFEDMVRSGNVPTDIIITVPWHDPPDNNPLVFIENDRELIEQLVPFRYLPRDMAIFVHRARYRGGFVALYEETEALSDKVLEDRGYHFVAGQSVNPDGRLAENFSLNSDQPSVCRVRDFVFEGRAFERLKRTLEENGIQAFIAPTYFRVHEYRPCQGPNLRLRDGADVYPYITVLGEDYLSLPNRYFSDPVHANRDGATFYTKELWNLIKAHIKQDDVV